MKKFLILIVLLELLLVGVFLATPHAVGAQTQDDNCPEGTPAGTVCLENPIKIEGVDSPARLVAAGLMGFASIIGLVAIAFTVFNGFRYVLATSEEGITEAKAGMTWSVGGFIVAILSFTIISGVARVIGFDASKVGEEKNILESPLTIGSADPGDFLSVMNFIMTNVLGLLGFATVLMIIYYGYRYITSRGNEEAIEQAKQGLTRALIGFVVIMLTFTIIEGVRRLLI